MGTHKAIASRWQILRTSFAGVSWDLGWTADASDAKMCAKHSRTIEAWCYTLVLTRVLWDDILQQSGYSPAPENSDKRWINAISCMSVPRLVGSLSEADALLLEDVEGTIHVASFDDFKHRLKARGGSMAVVIPISQLLAAYFGGDSVTKSVLFSDIHQCLSFAVRFNPFPLEIGEMYDAALEKFECVETGLKGLPLPSTYIRGCFTRWLRDWIEHRSLPLHVFSDGTGATREVKRRESWCKKQRRHQLPLQTVLILSRLTGCSVPDLIDRFGIVVKGWCGTDNPHYAARVNCVPKKVTAHRLITLEPTGYAWWQKGLADSLRSFIDCNRCLRTKIDIRDQSKNAKLAMIGSRDGSYSTIDLSSASDSVRADFVDSCLANLSFTRLALATARASHVVRSEDACYAMKIAKYAGMGNSITFPLECLVFLSIVQEAIWMSGGNPDDTIIRVYGDDIIVPTRYYDATVSRLEYYGFKVNETKSFHGTGTLRFRESCGGHYLNGYDVTPCYLSRHFVRQYCDALDRVEPAVSLMELCDSVFGRFNQLRTAIIQILFEWFPHALPAFGTADGLISLDATNFHLVRIASGVYLTHREAMFRKPTGRFPVKRRGSKTYDVIPDYQDSEQLYDIVMAGHNEVRFKRTSANAQGELPFEYLLEALRRMECLDDPAYTCWKDFDDLPLSMRASNVTTETSDVQKRIEELCAVRQQFSVQYRYDPSMVWRSRPTPSPHLG